jgi:hypothetical protein
MYLLPALDTFVLALLRRLHFEESTLLLPKLKRALVPVQGHPSRRLGRIQQHFRDGMCSICFYIYLLSMAGSITMESDGYCSS